MSLNFKVVCLITLRGSLFKSEPAEDFKQGLKIRLQNNPRYPPEKNK